MAAQLPPPYHYYQQAPHALAAAIVLPIINAFAVLLRILARKKQKLPIQTDDWLTVPALLLLVGAGAAMITGVANHALGYPVQVDHQPSRTVQARSPIYYIDQSIVIAEKVEYVMFITTILASGLIKLSFLFFYHRIFCVSKTGPARHIIVGTIVIVILWTLAFFFNEVFACGIHFDSLWGKIALRKYCHKGLVFQYGLSMSAFILDAIILIIPLPFLWKLRLQTSKKVAVSLVFLLGGFAVAASGIRLSFTTHAIKYGYSPNLDEKLEITGQLYWLLVEAGVGLFASCLPTVRFLFKGFSPESVISSIRSALSLHSLRSNHSRITHRGDVPAQTEEAGSMASDVGIVHVQRKSSVSEDCICGAVNTEVRDNLIEGQANGGLAAGLAVVDDPCTELALACILLHTEAVALGNTVIHNSLHDNDLDLLVNTTDTSNVIACNKYSTPGELCA
ncbi:hypothetical protein B0J14DRAFT_670688 [Halenospora varia]|nr:hypothetical protein B0J14DRAFT_670688 [Halenospora varia]